MNLTEFLAVHLQPSQLITDVMVLFLCIGAVDFLFGNRFGLGKAFTEGFEAFASLAVTMSGILVLVPLIGEHLIPLLSPFCSLLKLDPSVFAGILLACDMGAYPLAVGIAGTPEAAGLCGMILSSMMGVTIVFNIPVALGILEKKDYPAFSKGILCGFITIPFGCLIGGMTAGYPLSLIGTTLVPVIVFSILVCVCLLLIPNIITRVFLVFGKIISIIATVSCVAAIASALLRTELIPGLGSVRDAMNDVVSIVLILPGAYVLVTVISHLLKKPFTHLGKLLGINENATLGLLTSIANCVPTFRLIRDMDERGKIVNFAFLVSAGFLLGDHLAFCSAMDPVLIPPLLLGKLAGGISAALLALLLTRQKTK
ncbi:MAG: ethanolamine utilization protein EutH [Clostridia bacterium]|nr:ethanolamine utilization protein EutH [Clostridia bacterium]